MTPPSNDVTRAVAANGQQYIFVQSTADGRPYSTQIHLSDGTSLGAVQAVTWSLKVGDIGARCVVETIATPADLRALMDNTTMCVKPWGSPARWLVTYYWARIRRWVKATYAAARQSPIR